MGDLSPNFSAREWRQPALYGLPAQDYPEQLVQTHLVPLARDVLEVVRAETGRPLIIIPGGGWRSQEWQRRHGGTPGSRHVVGDAADVRCRGLTGERLHSLVLQLWLAGQLPALGGLGLYPGRTFCHVDVRPHSHRELAQWTGSARGRT